MIFGARGQLVVGAILMIATIAQTVWWLFVTPPTVRVVFIVSMEALAFASFNQVASALGYRATERVEAKVVENVEKPEKVEINGK